MPTRIKVLPSHAAHARYLAEGEWSAEPVGTIPHQIPTPYSYSQTHLVWLRDGIQVFTAETRHRRFEVYRVDGPLGPVDA